MQTTAQTIADAHTPGDGWIEYDTPTTHAAASKLARGDYQLALLDGEEALSGSTLTGKARHWSSRYASSRRTLLARLEAAGFAVGERRGEHNKRILCISGGTYGQD